MGNPTFSSPLNFGFAGPGQKLSRTTKRFALSEAVTVLADISGDTVFSVVSGTSYLDEQKLESPGDGPHGPLKPIMITVAEQQANVDGSALADPSRGLHVGIGQWVEIGVQFAAPDGDDGATSYNATLQIQGVAGGTTVWTASVTLTALLGEVTIEGPPAITIAQNETSPAVEVKVKLIAGPTTSVGLTLESGSFSPTTVGTFPMTASEINGTLAPGRLLKLEPITSTQLSSTNPTATWLLTASPGTMAIGTYSFPLKGTAFGGAYTFFGGVTVTVTLQYFVIESNLGSAITVASDGADLVAAAPESPSTDSQQWPLSAIRRVHLTTTSSASSAVR